MEQLGIAPPKPWVAEESRPPVGGGDTPSALNQRNHRLGIRVDGGPGVKPEDWYSGMQYLARYGNVDFDFGG